MMESEFPFGKVALTNSQILTLNYAGLNLNLIWLSAKLKSTLKLV